MPIFETPTLVVRQDRKVILDGLEMPGAECVEIHRGHGRRAIIVLKVPGHHYWSGIGQPQSYAPGRFSVFEYTWETEEQRVRFERFLGAVTGEGQTLEDQQPGTNSRRAISLRVTALVDFEIREKPLREHPAHHRPKMRLPEAPQPVPAT